MAHVKTVLLAATVASSNTAALIAQENDIISLDPIYVELTDPNTGAADRATSAYVSEAELETASMGDLKDLFAGISSVSVGGAIPVAQKIFVNGVDMLNLGVKVDGVAQNNRIFHHVSANAFDPGLMKFVRVDPGVAPADAGFEALAGAVTMETIDVADMLEAGDNFGGRVRLSYSDNGNTFGRAVTLAAREVGFEGLAYLKKMDGDDYEDGDDATVLGTGSDLDSGLVKLAYESEAGDRVEFSAQKMQDDALRNRRANFGAASWNPLELYETERTIYALHYENTQAAGLWDPEITLGYSATEVGKEEPYDSSGMTDTLSLTVQNTFHLSEAANITAGVDYIDKTSQYSIYSTGEKLGKEHVENIGIFAQARFEPVIGLDVSAGVRFDSQTFTDVNDVAYDNDGLSGNLSVQYAITERFSVRAGYSNVFGGIPIEDNYLFADAWDYSGLTEVTRGKNFVLGADWEDGPIRLGAEIFKTNLNNVRTSAYDGAAGNYVAGHADFESKGFTLAGSYDWLSGFARASYTYSEARLNGAEASSYAVLDYGTPLGGVFSLEVQQELVNHDLVLGGSIDAALDYDLAYDTGDGDGFLKKMPGYVVANVFAEYRPQRVDDLTIRFEINNLFDETYADRATYGSDYTEDQLNTLKESGRSVGLIVTKEF